MVWHNGGGLEHEIVCRTWKLACAFPLTDMPDSSATRLTVFVCYLACIGWVGGCASDTEAAPTPQDPVTMDASSGVPLDGGAPSKSDATHACLEGSAQSCTCPNGRGTRTCQSGVFGSCSECKTIDVQLPKCAAGHYEGAFEMRYRSGPSGVCGLFAQLDEGVAQGHWSFSLASSATADSYTVNAGCLTAGDSGATVPIYASITGSVECSSGKFLGELRGT
ncbi:MAG: hypothetical protein JWN48_4814, partial [Myxococcaceae bacterium]|nr:hypothetical protein [Myxococcaceae bacterium]